MSQLTLLLACLIWYLSVGLVIAILQNISEREAKPLRRVGSTIIVSTLWFPILIWLAMNRRKICEPERKESKPVI